MNRSGTLSILMLRGLEAALERGAVSPTRLFGELGIAPEVLNDREARISAPTVFRALQRAIALTGNECFCLEAAAAIPIGALEVLDFSMRSSASMGDALRRAVQYFALLDDGSKLSIERDGPIARLVGSRGTSRSSRAATDLLFALLLERGKALTGRAWPLRDVCFVAEPPTEPVRHARYFGVPVHFSSPRNELVFDAGWLETPCLARDPVLASYLDRQAEELMQKLRPASPDFRGEVRDAIAQTLRGAEPRIELAARRLGVSSRTLQRRLHEVDTSFAGLVLDVRRELAQRLLGSPAVPIGEVAYLLGFSDASTFHRAFKQWTGHTPAQQRRLAQTC